MILLETGNRILAETIEGILAPPAEADPEEKKEKKHKRDPVDIRLCDFDQVTYRVVIAPEQRDILTVSMTIPCYEAIQNSGASAALKNVFGAAVTDPTDGYSVAVSYNLENLEKKEEVVKNLSHIRSIVLGGVWRQFYTGLNKGEAQDAFKFDVRSDTTVYFIPDKERVTTIFAFNFSEKVDKVLARVFMQEFVDARRNLGFAPAVAWNSQPPSELAKWNITENKDLSVLGFVSFAVLKSHVSREAQIEQIVAVMQNFRNYIQYHIKCSKSYFHSRMRARVISLLKVLNRAKVEDPEKDKSKGKKTISGKTFRRAV
jgi:actin related protein 2/3 complex subunit 2